jgi:nicotinate-nucleotide adenylyltransferase
MLPWTKPTRVALFGTSADPPHVGHQSILNWLAQAFDQVAVWAAENPYKAHQSPLGDRAEMLRLLISTLPDANRIGVSQLPQWYQASEIFAQVEILVFPRPGYSIQGPALSALQQQATVTIAEPPQQYNIASSRYRTAECHQVPDDLPPVIRDYISEHHLYSCLQKPPAQLSTRR